MLRLAAADPDAWLGMAESYLFLGQPGLAGFYVEAVRRADPLRADAIAVHVRILLRAARFDAAVAMSTRAVRRLEAPPVALLAAHASALFRVQRTVDAASAYQQVIALEPRHPEAHLRLGSGLTAPCRPPILQEVRQGIVAQRTGQLAAACDAFAAALARHPGHPIAHRLLGETLYASRLRHSMVRESDEYRELAAAIPVPSVKDLPVERFLPHYDELGAPRRRIADRALALFGRHLPRLVAMHGRHDLLREDERTTEAFARASLRGKLTFDGRVWDDVRGIGGLRAATGIESLDEAAAFGFDTLSHEIAHQAHLYAFKPVQRARVRRLYDQALAAGRCLDFYAASNEAEYFGQGVEAFVSLAKRPGCEKTHGHTRFELYRLDPELHDFIAREVDWDPLRTAGDRARILPAAVAVAIRCGRPEDALVAAGMMAPGPEQDRCRQAAQHALAVSRTL